ncbi:hypothetical protein L9F63_012949, partial [Diploptera punctata]
VSHYYAQCLSLLTFKTFLVTKYRYNKIPVSHCFEQGTGLLASTFSAQHHMWPANRQTKFHVILDISLSPDGTRIDCHSAGKGVPAMFTNKSIPTLFYSMMSNNRTH